MGYPKLEEVLKSKKLVKDEVAMWSRVGFYITNEPYRPVGYNELCVTIYDGMANKEFIGATMGLNIRESIIRWWEVEKVKPRAKETTVVVEEDPTGLSQLENRSAT